MTVLGVDGCKGGWVVAVADEGGLKKLFKAETIADAARQGLADHGAQLMVVDIPIGLPPTDSREADREARSFLSPRGSCVFPTPLRVALQQPTYELAKAASRAAHARGMALSKQAHELGPKILEVDTYRLAPLVPVLEGHPEVSFRAMTGTALTPKRRLAGREERRLALALEGIDVPSEASSSLPGAAPDDVLDAAAMAWTALRVMRGEAVSLPSPPEQLDGWPAAIWY